jgi:hypothetical protein
MAAATKTPPWKRKNPKKGASTKLADAEKARARARAKKAGRRYPNLVDNMAVVKARAAKKEAPAPTKATRPKARKASRTSRA